MAISQLHLIPRRVAHSAGHSLIEWATRPTTRASHVSTIDRETALRRYRARHQLDVEQHRALNVNAFMWLRL